MIVAGRSRSSASRRAAVARKSGLAKVDHLLCQLAERAGRVRARRVRRYGATGERGFTELDGLLHDRAEDVVVAEIVELFEHLAPEDRAPVVEGRQEAEDLEVAIEALGADLGDHLDQRVEALQRIELRLH